MPREIITLQVGQCGNQSTKTIPLFDTKNAPSPPPPQSFFVFFNTNPSSRNGVLEAALQGTRYKQ